MSRDGDDTAPAAGAAAADPNTVESNTDDTLAGAVDRSTPGRVFTAPLGAEHRAVGSHVGRFAVLEAIGAGGMGVVYKAYDPVLDRAVAVKVVRSTRAPHHLLREAQALARLQHPNVLTVHEAGVDDGEPYLATELVDGEDLAAWLASAKRTREQILEVFEGAGRGLAAAHAAGLVHRDFKPSNVLVGRDGRVRVADFGIARGSGDESAAPSPTPSRSPLPSLAMPGQVIGTPAYMAPEQAIASGGPSAESGPARTQKAADAASIDARADQFSFCVSLWEALTGIRPFTARSVTGLADQIRRGAYDETSAASLPPRMRRALIRGLSYDRDERFPSMEALMAALRPPVLTRRWIVVAGGGVLSVVAALWLLVPRAVAPTCTGFAADLAGAWDDATRRSVASAFAAATRPDARDARPRTEQALDVWTAAWLSERQDACADTRIRGGQSEAVMDRRMDCLDRLRGELAALTQLLAAGGDDVLARSTGAVLALRPPSLCARGDAFAPRPTASDAAGRERLARLESGLAELKALHDAARHRDGLAKVDAVIADARAAAAHALVAEALLWRGKMFRQLDQYDDAVAAYREATGEAEAAGDDRLRFEIAVRTIDVVGYYLEDPVRTAWMSRVARGILDHLGNPPELVADLEESLTNAENRFGHFDLARQHADAMMALRRGRVAPDQPEWARTLRAYARVTQKQGELDITDRYLTQALAIMERHLGPDHPDLGYYLHNVGILQLQRGDLDAAEATMRRLLASDLRAYGPNNGKTGRTWKILGSVLYQAGRFAEAADAYQRATAIQERAVGPRSAIAAEDSMALADVLWRLGRGDEAWARGRDALAILREHPDDDGMIASLTTLAEIARGRGDAATATALVEEAMAIASRDPATPVRGLGPLLLRGELRQAAGRSADAQVDLERALAILDAHPQAPDTRAQVELALARALRTRDPSRARALATAARDRCPDRGLAGDTRRAAAAFLGDLGR